MIRVGWDFQYRQRASFFYRAFTHLLEFTRKKKKKLSFGLASRDLFMQHSIMGILGGKKEKYFFLRCVGVLTPTEMKQELLTEGARLKNVSKNICTALLCSCRLWTMGISPLNKTFVLALCSDLVFQGNLQKNYTA